MSSEIVESKGSELVEYTPGQDTEEVLNSDVVVPKLLLMQGLSEFVNERQAQQGEIVKSTTVEKVGDPETPVEIIPITFRNAWTEFEIVGGDKEFRGTYERNARNEHDPWDYEKDGASFKRVKSIEVFALLPSDIEKEIEARKAFEKTGELPDLTTTLLPVVLSFRSTSYNAGKTIATHFAMAKSMSQSYGKKIEPYRYKLVLSTEQTKNDKGTFYVFKCGTAGKASDAEFEAAAKWADILRTQSVQVDSSGENEGSGTTTESTYEQAEEQF